MMDLNELYESLLKQEQDLQFEKFNAEIALELGLRLIEMAKKSDKKVTMDITFHGHRLFHYAFDGTSPDNEQWIYRKCNVVNRFHMSSYRMGIKLKRDNATLEGKYFVSDQDYAPHGGCFPIIIKGVGFVGTITVSGLPQAEDHAMVVTAIENYLKERTL
ncbi:MAG: heme-degrading domain-containing protein [Vallitaleaceae bacterium]|nr:heme-degrading domain-containing protein [Vallitaleaceae bacterium]